MSYVRKKKEKDKKIKKQKNEKIISDIKELNIDDLNSDCVSEHGKEDSKKLKIPKVGNSL